MQNYFKGLFDSELQQIIEPKNFLLCIGCALLLGLILAAVYTFNTKYTKSFLVTLALRGRGGSRCVQPRAIPQCAGYGKGDRGRLHRNDSGPYLRYGIPCLCRPLYRDTLRRPVPSVRYPLR